MHASESKAAQKRREKAEAREALRRILAPGATVWATVRSVSRSGMSRRIDLYAIERGEPTLADPRGDCLRWLSSLAGRALGWPCSDAGLRVDGCGMDMRFHAVDVLSAALYGFERGPDGKGYAVARLRMERF